MNTVRISAHPETGMAPVGVAPASRRCKSSAPRGRHSGMSGYALITAFNLLLIAAANASPRNPALPETNHLAQAEAQAFREAAGHVAPGVVTIETVGGAAPIESTSRGPRRPRFTPAEGPTTGLIWSADGLILTSSFNFVRQPSVITVILADGRRYLAELLARDEIRKLAMLKIDAADLPVPEWLTDAEQSQVGQWAVALGRGFGGPECSLNVGIISGLNRMSGLALQTDARISPANFGGPLVDLHGRIVGLCVPIGLQPGELSGVEFYDSGIGFAIPYTQIAAAARDLALGRNLRQGLLGVSIDRRTADRVRVAGVGDPSPARRAGLQPGDEIIAIDDQPVGHYLELRRLLRPRCAGRWVTLRIRRGPSELDVPVILAVPEDIGPVPAPALETRNAASQPEK